MLICETEGHCSSLTIPHSPLLLDDVLEGGDHARGVLARVELLAGLDDIEGVKELRVSCSRTSAVARERRRGSRQ